MEKNDEAEGTLQRFLNRMTDLLCLNLITLALCLPVITAGASLTAMHFVLLKMVRGQEGYIVPTFMRSFRKNLRQAVIIWTVMLLYGLFALANLTGIVRGEVSAPVWLAALLGISVLTEYLLALYIFPLLSRYENTIAHTLSNALTLVFRKPLLTIAMAVITAVPFALLTRVRAALPLVLLLGLSVPGYACAALYDPLFKRIEGTGSGDFPEQADDNGQTPQSG